MINSVSVSHFVGGNTATEAFLMGIIISSVEKSSYFGISQILFFDIQKKNHLDFLISQKLICDIKNNQG